MKEHMDVRVFNDNFDLVCVSYDDITSEIFYVESYEKGKTVNCEDLLTGNDWADIRGSVNKTFE